MDELTRELQETITRRPEDIVVVVGAGLPIASLRGSSRAEFASWGGLLASGLRRATELHRVSPIEVQTITAKLASPDPMEWIQAAEAITNALGGVQSGDFAAWLRATVGSLHNDLTDRRLAESLRHLSDAGVLLATVNYDGILEDVTGLQPITWREPIKVERILRGYERGILHLHGFWDDPRSIVFGERSYNDVSHNPHARAVLTALRIQKTFLFVGHGAGLDDPNWGSFLRWTENAFAGSEHLHYRLVREAERAKVQAGHPIEQRLVALPFGSKHDDLAPFLRSLLPRGKRVPRRPQATRAQQTVILLLNVLERDHTALQEEKVRSAVDDEDAIILRLDATIDRKTIRPRSWRELARAIERLAHEATTVDGNVKYVVCGKAPLPVFAYLGDRMRNLPPDSMVFLNYYNKWDWIECPIGVQATVTDHFTEIGPPVRGSKKAKRVVLSVMPWQELVFTRKMVEPRSAEAHEAFSVFYPIHAPTRSRTSQPMTGDELLVVIAHVEHALAWFNRKCTDKTGLTVALAGPAWLAFWIGHRLNPRAKLGRVDYLDFDKDRTHFTHALASPRHEVPWLSGRPRLLFLGAEPNNLTRTKGTELVTAIKRALGPAAETYELQVQHCVKPEDFRQAVKKFKPDILHMHLHGSFRGVLGFENEQRDAQEVSHELFVRALKHAGIEPALIVMSSCHTAMMASELKAIGECVITMKGELNIQTAIAHAGAFYQALAAGISVDKAAEEASRSIEFRGKPSYEVIQTTSEFEDELEDVVLFRGLTRPSKLKRS